MLKMIMSKETSHTEVGTASKQINGDNPNKVKHEAASISGIQRRNI
jgi:hypothetical protein